MSFVRTNGLTAPVYTTAERNALTILPNTNPFIFNSDTNTLQYYNGTLWGEVGSAGASAHVIEDEGVPLPQQTNLNFVGAGVIAADSGGVTIVTIPGGGGGGSGYDTIEEESVALTQRTTLDFQGAGVTATDDGSNTVITIPGGGGGGALQTTRVSRTTDQVLPTGVPTNIIWEVEDVDDDNQFGLGNPTQIVIATTGEYFIGFNLFTLATTFDWQWALNVNGSSIDEETFINSTAGNGTQWTQNRRSNIQFSLTAGDIITLNVLPNTPSVTIEAKSKFWATRIS